jgi:methylated-DNA-[protein]-cysteine S-methyltransferase
MRAAVSQAACPSLVAYASHEAYGKDFGASRPESKRRGVADGMIGYVAFHPSGDRTMTLHAKTFASPVGALTLVASDAGLVAVLWEDDAPDRVRLGTRTETPDHPLLMQAERELADYFAGRTPRFAVPLDMRGTAFQKSVWQALIAIPFGETRSYATIARQIGRPTAMRAVGAANGRNPISIIVPCHRVVGADGTLTGFAGGLAAKAYLLALERDRTRAA